MRSRWIVAVALVVVCAIALVLVVYLSKPTEPDLSLERVRSTGVLTVGIDPSYPPFEETDASGQLAGFDVDLANELASRLGAQANFVAIDMGGIVDALIAKKIDVIVCGMSPFPEYRQQLGYSQSYFEAGSVIVTRPGAVSRLDDLTGKTVTVESGSGGDLEMVKQQQRLEGMVLKPRMTAQEALEAVKEGQADAAVVDAISALQFIGANGGLTIVGQPITDEPFVVATRLKDQLLLTEIDRIIGELRGHGYFDQLKGKWFQSNAY